MSKILSCKAAKIRNRVVWDNATPIEKVLFIVCPLIVFGQLVFSIWGMGRIAMSPELSIYPLGPMISMPVTVLCAVLNNYLFARVLKRISVEPATASANEEQILPS